MKLIAIIPARMGSKRLPNKNFKEFFGKPIIYWVLDEIIKSELFDKVVISTDSEEKSKVLGWYNRPHSLCSDTTTVDEVCLDVLEKYPGYDYLCCVYPTAYAVTWQDLHKAFIQMLNGDFNSCYSYGMLNGDYNLDNGGLYYSKVESFLKSGILINEPFVRYEMPQIDINTLIDFAKAKIHALTLDTLIPGGRFK